MAETHPSFRQPADTTISVWRYTDLSKFVWMLQSSALYFARADLLGDPYEGYVTKRMALEGPPAFIAQMTAEMEKSSKAIDEKTLENLTRAARTMFGGDPTTAKCMFVNCWHMAKHESAAMWKLYSTDNHSICIRSTYAKLWESLPAKDCYLGEVTYLDYESEFFALGNMFNYVLHKRTSFQHEQEIRAVMMDATAFTAPDDCPTHKKIDINLKALVHDVYVGPIASPPLLEVVQKLADQAGLEIEVKQSGLNAPPAY